VGKRSALKEEEFQIMLTSFNLRGRGGWYGAQKWLDFKIFGA
jgi:hypothetical protein